MAYLLRSVRRDGARLVAAPRNQPKVGVGLRQRPSGVLEDSPSGLWRTLDRVFARLRRGPCWVTRWFSLYSCCSRPSGVLEDSPSGLWRTLDRVFARLWRGPCWVTPWFSLYSGGRAPWACWRIRLVAYGARLESVLGNSLRGSNPLSSAWMPLT